MTRNVGNLRASYSGHMILNHGPRSDGRVYAVMVTEMRGSRCALLRPCFSRPTHEWLTTPGTRILPGGSFTSCQTFHSCS